MARPVVGGHFAFLALERACGGKAIEALRFLDEIEPKELDVVRLLRRERELGLELQQKEGWRGEDL